jgi:hypothetical protein
MAPGTFSAGASSYWASASEAQIPSIRAPRSVLFVPTGGAIGVSLLNNFITRQGQIHRGTLTAHSNHANPFFERPLNAMTQNFIAMGASTSDASHRTLAQLSAQIDLQSNVIGFVNSFWVLGLLVLLLVPLPFIMRRPSPEEAKASAAAH